MNTPDARAEARDRANRRLRRMTIGTAALGVAATGLLGMTAAIAYDGSSTTSGTVALVAPGDTATGTASTRSSTSSTSTTPRVTTTQRKAHASTGGS